MPTDNATLRTKVREVIQKQPYFPITVLSSLLAIQDALGYLSPEAMEEVARHTGETVNDVWGVASFYLNFRFSPPGQHIVEVCRGPSCHIMGAMGLLQGVLNHLGLEGEGDTADGKITVKLNTCLGACPHGPVISVDEHLAGPVTLDRARDILDSLRGGGPSRGNGTP